MSSSSEKQDLKKKYKADKKKFKLKKKKEKRELEKKKEKRELEKKKDKKVEHLVAKKTLEKPLPDMLQEQVEKPMTTSHCPESVKASQLSDVKKNAENYLEVNMINKNRMVDNFYIKSSLKHFKYRKKTYDIDEKRIYLLPSKTGFFMLTSFYKENSAVPKNFEKTNKGITSKALTLLYNERLYEDMFAPDETKYNFFIAIFSVANFIAICIGLYLLFRGG